MSNEDQSKAVATARAKYIEALNEAKKPSITGSLPLGSLEHIVRNADRRRTDVEVSRLEYELEYERQRALEMAAHIKSQDRTARMIGVATTVYALGFVAWAAISILLTISHSP